MLYTSIRVSAIVAHLSHDLPREVQDALGSRRLARVDVRNDPYVSDASYFFLG